MSGDKKGTLGERKPPLGLIPVRALQGIARVFDFGQKKYAPGNYLQATLADGACERYVSAALRHISELQGLDGVFVQVAALDDDSGLPHIDHAICSLLMLRAIATKDGALGCDPGEGRVERQGVDSPDSTSKQDIFVKVVSRARDI